MTIRRTRFDERSEPDADGRYEFIYVGYRYEYVDNDYSVWARTYDDRPGLLSVSHGSPGWGKMPYGDRRFAAAIEALLTETGATTVDVMTSNRTGGYQPLDLDRMRNPSASPLVDVSVYPRQVSTPADFARAVRELRASLDAALTLPEPTGPWEDLRGDWWRNWDLTGWVNASHSYRSGAIRPPDQELLGTWQELLPERDGDERALQSHLTQLASWAESGIRLSPEAWDRAFEVLRVGAFYE